MTRYKLEEFKPASVVSHDGQTIGLTYIPKSYEQDEVLLDDKNTRLFNQLTQSLLPPSFSIRASTPQSKFSPIPFIIKDFDMGKSEDLPEPDPVEINGVRYLDYHKRLKHLNNEKS